MTAEQEKQTWRHWNEINPALFQFPADLYSDPGKIGCLLRKVPLDYLKDANRCLNPWQELATMQHLKEFRPLFSTCKSVGNAWLILASTGWKGATRPKRGHQFSERLKTAKTQANKDEGERLENRIVDAMLRFDAKTASELIGKEGADKLIRDMRNRGRRPLIGNERSNAPERLNQRYPIHVFLATYWLRIGRQGDPGLCFFSNQAIANLISLLDWSGLPVIGENVTSEQIEANCIDLGLRRVNAKCPEISDARLTETGAIQLNTLPPKMAREVWPKDAPCLRAPILFGERKLYAGFHAAPRQSR